MGPRLQKAWSCMCTLALRWRTVQANAFLLSVGCSVTATTPKFRTLASAEKDTSESCRNNT